MSDEKQSGGGIGFCGWLCLLFIALKLTNYIAWSWWWVLSPILIPVGICFAIAIIALFVLIILKIFQ